MSGSENSSQLRTEEMALLAREGGVGVNTGIQVTSEDVFNQTGKANVFGLAFGQLNPVVQDVISNPVNACIDTTSTRLDLFILVRLFDVIQETGDDPVVLFSSENFTTESEGACTTHDSQFLKRLGQFVSKILAERDACPLEHVCFFVKAGNHAVELVHALSLH